MISCFLLILPRCEAGMGLQNNAATPLLNNAQMQNGWSLGTTLLSKKLHLVMTYAHILTHLKAADA